MKVVYWETVKTWDEILEVRLFEPNVRSLVEQVASSPDFLLGQQVELGILI